MLTKLFRPSGMALGIVIASLFLGTNVLAKDWHHHKHYRSHSRKDIKAWVTKVRAERPSLMALQEQIAALQGDMDALKELVETLQVDLEAQAGELNAELESVQANMADLQSQVEANMGDVEATKAQLADQEAAAVVLEAELKVLKDQMALLDESKQETISQSCDEGMALREVHADGSVTCAQVAGGSSGGSLEIMRVVHQGIDLYPNAPGMMTVMCDPGYSAIGGGFQSTIYGFEASSSYSPAPGVWAVFGVNKGATPASVKAEVYCARIQ
jgi:septal ring factor EnvC (AmiA/AmiB activator)